MSYFPFITLLLSSSVIFLNDFRTYSKMSFLNTHMNTLDQRQTHRRQTYQETRLFRTDAQSGRAAGYIG